MKKKLYRIIFLVFLLLGFLLSKKTFPLAKFVLAQSPQAQIRPTVFVASFSFERPLHDPKEWTNQLIAGIREGSTYHGYKETQALPFVNFQIYGGQIIEETTWLPPKLDSGDYDITAIYNRYHLCDLIQQGKVDEVWFWDAGQGGFFEYVINGPNWSVDSWSNHVPNCGRQIVTMTFNYHREIDVAFESFVHRMERTFMHYFPCDFYTDTWPWTYWPSQCQNLVSNLYGFVARPFAGNNFVGVCGDAHAPPNIMDDRSYVYDDRTTVQSICEDWQWNGTSQVTSFNCERWGCSHANYHLWWMQNIPGFNNNNHDRAGHLQPNWWQHLFDLHTTGDFNSDGLINTEDAKILLKNWAAMTINLDFDLNNDGQVNGLDFNLLRKLIL